MNMIGKRVALRPHTDLWMQGERFGTIRQLNRSRAEPGVVRFGVVLDKSGRLAKLHQQHVEVLWD